MDKMETAKESTLIIELRVRGGTGTVGDNILLFALDTRGQVTYSKLERTGKISRVQEIAQLIPEQSAALQKELGIGDWFYKLNDHYNVGSRSDAWVYAMTVRYPAGEKTVRVDNWQWDHWLKRWKAPWRFVRLFDKLRLYRPPTKNS